MPKDHDQFDNEKEMGDTSDIELDAEAGEGSSLRRRSEKDLREALKVSEKEKSDYLAGWQRAKADLINYRREVNEERERSARFATEDFVRQLLPVLDSFDMALAHGGDAGLGHIHKQLLSILRGEGIEAISAEGKIFDPAQHESIGSIGTNEKEKDHMVLEVVQTGYTMHGRVIRPARVKIGVYQS